MKLAMMADFKKLVSVFSSVYRIITGGGDRFSLVDLPQFISSSMLYIISSPNFKSKEQPAPFFTLATP